VADIHPDDSKANPGLGTLDISRENTMIIGKGWHMKKTLLLILLLLLSVLVFAQDFRQVSWGMTPEEVIKIEGPDYQYMLSESRHDSNAFSLWYDRPLIGVPGQVMYGFENGQLKYAWHSTQLDIFERLLAALVTKYGRSDEESTPRTGFRAIQWTRSITSICLSRLPGSVSMVGYTMISYSAGKDIKFNRTKEDAEQL
jgi:hypothetical protein